MNNEGAGNESEPMPEGVSDAFKKDIEDTRADLLSKQELHGENEVNAEKTFFSIEEYTAALTQAGISVSELLRNVYVNADIEGSRAQVNMQHALANELGKKENIVLPETADVKEGLYKLYLELEEFTAPTATSEDLKNALLVIDSMAAIYSSIALSTLRKRTALRLERAQEKLAWDAQ